MYCKNDRQFEDDYQVDNGNYGLVNNLEAMFGSAPWKVPEVRVLYDLQGKPLALIAISRLGATSGMRKTLPIEFFNHQLLGVDYKNPEKLAAFMDTYGFFGARPFEFGDDKIFAQALEALDTSVYGAVQRFEEQYGYTLKPAPFNSGFDFEPYKQHYAALKSVFPMVKKKLDAVQGDANLLGKRRIVGLISIERAQYRFEDWLYCVKHIQAMILYKSPKEIAQALGEDEVGIMRACQGACNIIQRQLNEIHPSLGIVNLDNAEFYRQDSSYYKGSFERALALQIWNFVLEADDGFTVCKECGRPFVHKQSRVRKSQSRSSSVFCCDRCKNRYAQRKYRQSEGYKLKQGRQQN